MCYVSPVLYSRTYGWRSGGQGLEAQGQGLEVQGLMTGGQGQGLEA